MKKFWLVLQREYLTRIRKKSFIIITLLAPFLLVGFYSIPIILAVKASKETNKVAVISEVKDLKLQSTPELTFVYPGAQSLDDLTQDLENKVYDGVLIIPADFETQGIHFYKVSDKALELTSKVQSAVNEAVRQYRLNKLNISPEQLAELFKPVNVQALKWTPEGVKASDTGARAGLAFAGILLIYMFIFMYGGMAMRSVMEEKVNRVVELLVSSVRPFELMFGKLVGIMLVALTQFVIWIVLAIALFKGSEMLLATKFPAAIEKAQEVIQLVKGLNLGLWLVLFAFYFFTGYLFYASMFAAIGASVDVETDSQQFMLPLTLPMIFTLISMQALIMQPDGQLAVWLSIIPFTSPLVMMIRVSFGVGSIVPIWQLILSLVIMILSVLGAIWAAAKIFRMGILFYGKKLTYKDLWKWIKA